MVLHLRNAKLIDLDRIHQYSVINYVYQEVKDGILLVFMIVFTKDFCSIGDRI